MEHGKLALTRKPNQTVSLRYKDETGTLQEITVAISDVRGNQIRMDIDAPKSVTILRGELLERQLA